MLLSLLLMVGTAVVACCHSTVRFWGSNSGLMHQALLRTEPSCPSGCILIIKTLKAHSISSFNFLVPICQVYHSTPPSATGGSQVGAGMRNSGYEEPTLRPLRLGQHPALVEHSLARDKQHLSPKEINYAQGNLPTFCLTPFLNILIAAAAPKRIKHSSSTVRRLPGITCRACTAVFILPDRRLYRSVSRSSIQNDCGTV